MSLKLFFLIILLIERSTPQLNLTLFHNTDMYSRFEETLDYETEKMVGGFSRLSQVLEAARKEAFPSSWNHILYLNAGNTFTGTYLYHIHRWKIVAALMNVLKPDAIALGSQEFVDGLQDLEPFLDAINFSVVASNILAENDTVFSRRVHPSIVLNFNNVSVGIIGYAAATIQGKYPVGDLQFTDELTAVQKECRRMDELGVKIVIALGNADLGTDLKIAKNAECLDVVVGGDSKLFTWNDDSIKLNEDTPSLSYPIEVTNSIGKIVLLLEGYSKTRCIGRVNLIFDLNGDLKNFKGGAISLDERILKSDEMEPLLRQFSYPATHIKPPTSADIIIGKSKVFLSAENCREDECNLGNMIVDSFIEYKAGKYKGKYWTDVPIAFMNAGSVRQSINTTQSGYNISLKALESSIPFRQPLIRIILQGVNLKHTLEVGARYNGETRRGEFLAFSGLRVIYDFRRPPFDRVVSVNVRCGECKIPSYSPIDYNADYKILTTLFLANGGDGHTTIRKTSRSFVLEGLTDLTAAFNYLQTFEEVRPECDDRIVHLSKQVGRCCPVYFRSVYIVFIIVANIFYIYLNANYLFL